MALYDSAWVKERANQTVEDWNASGGGFCLSGGRYSKSDQERQEQAYDEALVSAELKFEEEGRSLSANPRDALVESFGFFAARALSLEPEAIEILTGDFLPVGIELGKWARRFDSRLEMAEIIQAARNAWTACGLQPLLGEKIHLTPPIFAYSLMYPYSDNYLDDATVTSKAKSAFCDRFRKRLLGIPVSPETTCDSALWRLVEILEMEFPRGTHPAVFESLLSIHWAQEKSIRQVDCSRRFHQDSELLALSCEKGGASVLADACLVRGGLSQAESEFAFKWGVLLQLGDDLQDVREDSSRGSMTLFSARAASGQMLDSIAIQLLSFGERVAAQMADLPSGSETIKSLLKMSWQSLILRAMADSHEFFSSRFLNTAEQYSAFRFAFLRERSRRIAGKQGLYTRIFKRLIDQHGEADAM